MLSLQTALVLGLCMFLPSLTLADDHPPQSAEVYWRWKDEGNSNPQDYGIFTGHATVTWTRSAHCKSTGVKHNWVPQLSGSVVSVTAVTKQGSKDYMDPKSIAHWVHYEDTMNGCDVHSRTDFTVYKGGDRSQRMIIRLPDICTDVSCKGPNKEKPNVQCLNGPKGKIVMYLGKWIDECFNA
ncbi:uncharacterized protein MELLADRAFT_113412 [Melampsora larici-populina 98AG31]|uniref:Secreted protein n=1 Tax=Melampsora larici-populina (strain 98AG31 / pathotype 3-4-7) TaxID=747676 RepID=F4S9T1_MELLP|nr:uncharacterized protein MELLADRAFT_113412 [Melampsora larici-populina 98AG31]EGF98569.1 secreted protein [Melampsora larici-populina 98AG31]